MPTPQQGTILRTNVDETSTLQRATTIGDRAGEYPWMTTFNCGLSTLAKDDYGTRRLLTHEGAYALLTDASHLETHNVPVVPRRGVRPSTLAQIGRPATGWTFFAPLVAVPEC